MKIKGRTKTTVEPNAAIILRVVSQVTAVAALALVAVATRQAKQAEAQDA